MSMEDRIYANGRHDEFSAAVEKFRNGRRTREDQHVLYEVMTNCGATEEEADEFINIELENA